MVVVSVVCLGRRGRGHKRSGGDHGFGVAVRYWLVLVW